MFISFSLSVRSFACSLFFFFFFPVIVTLRNRKGLEMNSIYTKLESEFLCLLQKFRVT